MSRIFSAQTCKVRNSVPVRAHLSMMKEHVED